MNNRENASSMQTLKKIADIAASERNDYLMRAKASGKKVIGFFCSYVPEEIIHAAGFIPYRMRAVGSSGTEKGDIYFSSLNCTFVRHCFDKALKGDFDFLDGIVFLNGCDHTRRLYDNWRYADIPPEFRYMFVAPHKTGTTAEKRFSHEIDVFKSELERYFNVTISDETLASSIRLYNRKRLLLQSIYETGKSKEVPLRGSEFLKLMLALTAMPVEDSIALLEELKEELQGRFTARPGDLRIFLASGCVEEPAHLELIEELGASIVANNICLGTRNFNLPVSEDGEPIPSLAKRYLYHLSCPRMMNTSSERLAYMQDTCREFGVDAIIAEKLKFCDLWGGELFLYRNETRRLGIPLLALERELYGGSTGQMRTRIQAFYEQVRNRQNTTDDFFRAAGDDYQASDKS